jgi:hypothetical protein
MSYYIDDDYIDAEFYQSGVSIDWLTKVITIPQLFLNYLGGTSYQLDTNAFRIALRDIEDNADGVVFAPTHNHNTQVTLGGIQYARVIEILSPYTITFEDTGTPYVVSLSGSNNNILEKTNLGTVQVLSNNSAGLINLTEVQQAAFEGQVTISASTGQVGTTYPIGTLTKPVSNIADAKLIATARGIDDYYIIGNLTVGATDNVTGLHFTGDGATLNVTRTTVTLTSGCVTTNSVWRNCKITGYQGGESIYEDCIIDGLDNAHCFYTRCGLIDGASRGYTIRQTSGVSSGHASYFKECYSDEGTAIIDRNGARLNMTFDGWHGRIKFINQNHSTSSGQVWLHMNGGTVTIDSTCTKGKITITGTGELVNNSAGTEVDATGLLAEVGTQLKLDIESMRETHQGFGARFFVDWINGNDLAPGTSSKSPVKTITKALEKCVSGRGDVIYMLSPTNVVASWDERVVVNKEDVHIRGPGRGAEIKPLSGSGDAITIDANNCSLSGFVIRTYGVDENAVTINAKFFKGTKLYLVGKDAVGLGNGFLIRAGDYHEFWDCESEKFGGSGLKTYDAGLATPGSPREITIFGGNYYLNKTDGIELTSNTGAAAGASTRIVRIKHSPNITSNSRYGISIDSNSTRVVVDSDVNLTDNTVANILNNGPSTYIKGSDFDDLVIAMMAAAQATPIHADMRKTVGTALKGDGTEGDKFRSVLVP